LRIYNLVTYAILNYVVFVIFAQCNGLFPADIVLILSYFCYLDSRAGKRLKKTAVLEELADVEDD